MEFEVQGQQWARPRALSFVLTSPQLNEGVEFDVLPAFDVLGEPSRHRGSSLCPMSGPLSLFSYF